MQHVALLCAKVKQETQVQRVKREVLVWCQCFRRQLSSFLIPEVILNSSGNSISFDFGKKFNAKEQDLPEKRP